MACEHCEHTTRQLKKYRDAVEYGDKLHAKIRELKEQVENSYDEGYEKGYSDCERDTNHELVLASSRGRNE